jgi:hypothetical protein
MLLAPLVPTPLHCGNINIGGAQRGADASYHARLVDILDSYNIRARFKVKLVAEEINYSHFFFREYCSRHALRAFFSSKFYSNEVRILVKLGTLAFYHFYAHVPEHKLRVYIVYLFFYYRIEESFQRRQRYHFCLLVGKVAAVIMNPENKTDKTVKIS